MRKFNKPFHGVRDGEIYPVWFEVGESCPPELEAAAESLGVLGEVVENDNGEQTDGDGDGDSDFPAAELEAAADEAKQTEEKPASSPSESRRSRR